MDEIDQQILANLLKDARIPFSQIARVVGVSVDTVSKRYMRMKQEGVIRYATLLLDLTRLGEGLTVVLSLTVESGHSSSVEEDVKSLEEVFLMGKTFGAFDFIALVTVRDLEHLEKLEDKVSSIQGVRDCDVSVFTGGLTLVPSRQLRSRV